MMSDSGQWPLRQSSQEFQSTLLVWGATACSVFARSCWLIFQSTLLVWGATLRASSISGFVRISIHTPRMRSDMMMPTASSQRLFQSTLLVWGATVSILSIDLLDFTIYFSRTYPFSPQTPPFSYLSCKLHFLCDSTSHCFYNHCLDLLSPS